MTHKDPYPRLFFGNISFRRIYPLFGQLSPPVVKEFTALGTGSAGRKHRFRNIHRTLEGPAHKDPGSACSHGIDGIDLAKIMGIKFNPEFLGQLSGLFISSIADYKRRCLSRLKILYDQFAHLPRAYNYYLSAEKVTQFFLC